MEHYICRPVTELPAYMQAQFRVPEGEIITAGQVFAAEELDTELRYGNWTVFVPEFLSDIETQIPSIVLDGGFETLPDGRRPDGQPDYTEYAFTEGQVITAIRLLPETKFEIGYDSIIQESEIKVGGYLVPEVGSRHLIFKEMLEEADTSIYLVVEALKYFRIGGLYDNEFAQTVVARVKKQKMAGTNGLVFKASTVDNLEIPLNAQTVVATLNTVGGTAPYTYSLINGGQDNDLFEVDGNKIKNKEQITEDRTYHIAVKVTDKDGDTRNGMVGIVINSPSIKDINLTMTDDIRQGEDSTQPGGLIALAEVEGGTAPYIISLEGKDSDKFTVDLMSIKTGATPLNEGIYNVTIVATDSKNKIAKHELKIEVQEPYPDIESVTLNIEDNLTAPVVANTIVGHIQVLGGTPAYTFELPLGVGDNDLFIIEDAIKAKSDIVTPGNKTITVKVTDIHNKTKSASGSLSLAAPDITAINFSQTEGLREGETNVNTNAIIGTLSTTGGTAPISYSIVGGADSNLFRISGNSLRVSNTALTQGTYTISINASDNYGKSYNSDISITVEAAYEPISEVRISPVVGLTTPVAANTKVADITSTGGKPPVVYSLPTGISNNDSFKISGNEILVKDEITQSGSYGIIVKATDGNGNTKNSVTTAFTIADGQ